MCNVLNIICVGAFIILLTNASIFFACFAYRMIKGFDD